MSSSKILSDVAIRAAKLIADKSAWTQGSAAKTIGGTEVNPRDPDAVSWCARGALDVAAESYIRDNHLQLDRSTLSRAAAQFVTWVLNLNRVTILSLPDWNDDGERKHCEVLSLLHQVSEEASSHALRQSA
jgi:hypothetical protein